MVRVNNRNEKHQFEKEKVSVCYMKEMKCSHKNGLVKNSICEYSG